MKSWKIASLAALLCLSASVSGFAGDLQLTVTDGSAAKDLVAQGWTEISSGLWERLSVDGKKETYVSGAAGLEAVLPSLRDQESKLMENFLANPTAEAKAALDEQSQLVASVTANLEKIHQGAGREPRGAAAPAACSRTYSTTATVSRFHCIDSVYAAASYSTSNPVTCPELCTVHAYSFASSVCGGTPSSSSESFGDTGTNVSVSAYVWTNFGVNCYHYAYASVHCPDLANLYLSQTTNDKVCQCAGGC